MGENEPGPFFVWLKRIQPDIGSIIMQELHVFRVSKTQIKFNSSYVELKNSYDKMNDIVITLYFPGNKMSRGAEVQELEQSFIQFNHVFFQYGANEPWALDDLSLDIKKNEFVAIIGHNGSGKSTIAKLMNGLLFPQKGEILVDGLQVQEETVWDVRKKVGMVFQNPDNQFVGTTVEDDVAFGLENHGVPREDMLKRMEQSLQAVGMLDYRKHEPHRLSGGQKQRVAIASVLAVAPELIILDEATAMLDPKGRTEIMKTVQEIRQQRDVSILMITHDLNEVTFADRVIVMNQGKKLLEGTPAEVFQHHETLLEIGLDIPFVTKLAAELKQQGMKLTKEPLNQKELLEELWTLHSSR